MPGDWSRDTCRKFDFNLPLFKVRAAHYGETLDEVAGRYPGISGENIRDYNNIKMHSR